MELLASTLEPDNTPAVVAVDGEGRVKLRLPMAEGATQLSLGPTGRLGAGQGRWIAVRYTHPLGGPYVVAHSGRTGAPLWQREHFGCYGENGVVFALHAPTSVLDYNQDGRDDFLAQSENFYNLVEGHTGKGLCCLKEVQGQPTLAWTVHLGRTVGAPILADLSGKGRPAILVSTEDGFLHCLF